MVILKVSRGKNSLTVKRIEGTIMGSWICQNVNIDHGTPWSNMRQKHAYLYDISNRWGRLDGRMIKVENPWPRPPKMPVFASIPTINVNNFIHLPTVGVYLCCSSSFVPSQCVWALADRKLLKMVVVTKNSHQIVGIVAKYSLTKLTGQMSYWRWRPFLDIAKQLLEVMVICAIKEGDRY